MDANGTHFKLLLGEADWAACTTGGVRLGAVWCSDDPAAASTRYDRRRGELTLAETPWRFPAPAGAPRLRQSDRRGSAVDRFGNWYSIGSDHRHIRVLSSGSNRSTMFWPSANPPVRAGDVVGFAQLVLADTRRPKALRGLAVTEDHYLVAGSLEPPGLLVFDLRTGGPPFQVTWPDDVPFAPYDLAARPGGGVLVLDRNASGSRAWRLDRRFMVEPLGPPPEDAVVLAGTFGPLDGETAPPAPAQHRLTIADAAPLDGDPTAIDIAAGGVVVILDRAPRAAGSVIRLLSPELVPLPGPPRELLGLDRPIVAHDIAVVAPADRGPDEPFGDLLVVDEQGDQAYRFSLAATAGPLHVASDYQPMRLFGGRALVGTAHGAWYDFEDRWIRLVSQRRSRYAESAEVVTPVFDSGIPGCVWHRLLLDGCLTPDAGVTIRSAAADSAAALDDPDWQWEPDPYRRGDGPERPFVRLAATPGQGTHELLLQRPRGRYIRLRIDLTGNRQKSPTIRALRVYYPRFSYVEQYLPGVYREDPSSSAFLDGFLANFEGLYTSIEGRIAATDVLLDPRTAPAEALDWLAGWFDVVMDPGWDEARRRLFLRHAVELFRWRGTERGVRLALGLALLDCPDDALFEADAREPGGIRVVERFQTKRGPAVTFGDPAEGALPHPVPVAERWTPEAGGGSVHMQYRRYLEDLAAAGAIGPASTDDRRYPIVAPGGDRVAPWRAFSGQVLGFIPSASAADQDRWASFMRRRYLTVDALNRAHNRIGADAAGGFADVPVPTSLPPDGPPLADWFAFESIVLPGIRAAHRFRVMLPVPVGRAEPGSVVRAEDVRDRVADQERVARLVDLEKPAHTVFDVRSFWLAFRVGEARLGRDTSLDFGSRSPDLRPPAVLGSMHIGESVLTSAMTNVPERPGAVAGRDDGVARRAGRRTDG